jgi:hypothetical protein
VISPFLRLTVTGGVETGKKEVAFQRPCHQLDRNILPGFNICPERWLAMAKEEG